MKKTYLIFMVLALAALSATPELKAQTTCQTSQYTVTTDANFPTPDFSGNLIWRYFATPRVTNPNKISEAVMIVPRPVTPSNIVSPPALLSFCDARDTSSKINQGNCNGFPLPIPGTIVSGKSVQFEVVTPNTISEGLVSFNLVSGPGTSDVCVDPSSGTQRFSIKGPAQLGLQPIIANQCVKLDSNVSVQVTRAADYCANGVVRFFFNNTTCAGSDFADVQGVEIPGQLFAGSLDGNQRCAESFTRSKNSPVRYTYTSGGRTYTICYDDQTFQKVSCP